jgi:hypothetical protein
MPSPYSTAMFYTYSSCRDLKNHDPAKKFAEYLKTDLGKDDYIEVDRRLGVKSIPGYKRVGFYYPEKVFFYDYGHLRNSVDIYEKL